MANHPPLNFDPVAKRLADAWGFTATEELPGGHCSRVYASESLVLKVPYQGEEQTSGRIAALRLSGAAGPRVYENDEATGALLMERIRPGTSLFASGLDDDAMRGILLEFSRQVAHLPTDGLMPVADYVSRRDPLARELLETTPEVGFLHGDLHQENVLLGPNGWVLIDPKGLVGDTAFEPSAYIRNAPPGATAEVQRARIERVAEETGFDPYRVWAWSLLSIGSEESGDRWDEIRAPLRELGPYFRKST